MITKDLLKLLVPILGATTVALIGAVVVLFKKAKAAKPPAGAGAPGEGAETKATAKAETASVGGVIELKRSFSKAMSALHLWAPKAKDRLAAPWVLSIGRSGAGKSAILDTLPLQRMGTWTGANAAVGEAPCRFHFFERGVVLDLSGSLLSDEGWAATREAGWKALVTLLQQQRAERPADAIVLSIPITDLVGPYRLSTQELERDAARIQGVLQRLYLGLGLQIPIYVTVTQCDHLPGFSAFCRSLPPDRRQEMLGWSSPYSLGTAFTPEWIDEAVGVMSRSVQDAELAVWAGATPPADGEDLAALPSWITATAPALRQYLGRVFRMTTYEPAYPLRGIYWTGDAERAPRFSDTPTRAALAAPIATDVLDALPAESRPIEPAFVGELFNDKIFAEHGLARVARRTALSKNRAVAAMQIATAALLVFAPMGLYGAVNGVRLGSFTFTLGVREQSARIEALLKEVEKAGREMQDETIQDYIEIGPLLSDMAQVESGALRAFFIPASYMSPLHGKIRDAVQTAFADVLFPEFRDHLKDRRDTLLMESPPKGYAHTLPEYLTQLRDLGDATDRFNRLGMRGQGTTRDLAELIEYCYPTQRVSAAFFENDHYYRDALLHTQAAPIVVSPADQAAVVRRATHLIDESYAALVSRLGRGGSSPTDTDATDGMESIRADVAAVVGLRAFLDTAGPVDRALASFPTPFVFGDGFAPQVRSVLLQHRERLTGQLAMERFSGANGATMRALDQLLHQPFMQATTGRDIPTEIDGETTLRWDLQRLDQAIDLHTAYEKFVAHGLDSLPDGIRGNVRRLATAQAAAAMADLVAEGAIFAPGPAIGRGESLRDLRTRVTAFDQGMDRLSRIMDLFDTMGATPLVDDVDALTTAHASRLLRRIDAFADLPRRYVLPSATVATWNGQAPFSAVLGARETGLADFLGGEAESVRTAAGLARNVVAFLDSRAELDPDIAHSVKSWRDVLDALDRADQKPPTGPLAMLDKTVVAEVDSIDMRSCVRHPVRGSVGNDVMSRKLGELRQAVWRRCVDVATGSARISYAQLEETFRTRLAGRFPFSPTTNAPDASPADVIAFFKQYDALSPDAVTASGANAPRVGAFLSELDAVRRFFSPILDSAGRAPIFDYQVDFRVNRGSEVAGNQIAEWELGVGSQRAAIDGAEASRHGRWRSGDTLRVVLRWATGSPVVPVEVKGDGAMVHDGLVELGFGGRWSILRLLRAYDADVEDGENGQVIALAAQTARRQSLSEPAGGARVFLRVRLLHPDTKSDLPVPHFPVTAPTTTPEARR